jgi:hypothetical protein
MSTTVPETDDFEEEIPVPVIGDKFTYPATITEMATRLASRARHLFNTLDGQFVGETYSVDNCTPGFHAVNSPPLGRHNVLRTAIQKLLGNVGYVRGSVWGLAGVADSTMSIGIAPHAESDGGATPTVPGTEWQPTAASSHFKWRQVTTPTASPVLWWYVHGLPPAGTITQFGYRVQGGTGHGGTLPGTLPKLALYKRVTGASPVLIADKTDPTADAGSYETEHTVLSDGFDEPIGQDTLYFFRFDGESGSNKQDGLSIISCYITIGPP